MKNIIIITLIIFCYGCNNEKDRSIKNNTSSIEETSKIHNADFSDKSFNIDVNNSDMLFLLLSKLNDGALDGVGVSVAEEAISLFIDKNSRLYFELLLKINSSECYGLTSLGEEFIDRDEKQVSKLNKRLVSIEKIIGDFPSFNHCIIDLKSSIESSKKMSIETDRQIFMSWLGYFYLELKGLTHMGENHDFYLTVIIKKSSCYIKEKIDNKPENTISCTIASFDENELTLLSSDEVYTLNDNKDGTYTISGRNIYLINPPNESYEIIKSNTAP